MLAACVAAILTPLARHGVEGATPAFMWTADALNAGKTLLGSTCGAIVLGRAPAARQYTTDDDEMNKRIFSVAINGSPIWMLDNIKDRIEGGVLELALTAHDTIGARKLGHNVDVELPWRTTLYMTGNGATYSDDMSRRLLHIALLSRARVEGTSRASQAERSFKHPSLLAHTLANRPSLLRDALTILLAHGKAGRPTSGRVMPTFEAWANVVAHAVWWASDADPQRAQPPESASADTETARRVVLCWHAFASTTSHTLASIRSVMKGAAFHDPVLELAAAMADLAGVADLEKVSPQKLGRAFELHVVGRRFADPEGGTVGIVAAGESHGSKRYRSEKKASTSE